MNHVTRILHAIEQGDSKATDKLLPLVYEELRRLAAQKLAREAPGQTLQPTALVHEAYIRLLGHGQTWENQRHFFLAAAETMRRILVEKARRKQRNKHGGAYQRVNLDESLLSIEEPHEDILALNEALKQLSHEDTQVAEVVKLRYFAGLTLEQTSQILKISRRTVDRYWAYAKAWLFDKLQQDDIR
jgi:RNA polymerase sigma factor (TIGR02999 family)